MVTCDAVNNTGILSNTFTCTPEAPRFFNQTFRVKELVAEGTSIAKLNVSSSSLLPLIFSIIEGNDGDSFAVDSCSGLISVKNPLLLDYENISPGKNTFHLLISAAIFGFQSSVFTIAGVTINIDDADDPATLITKSISIFENSTLGTNLATVTAVDPEGDPVLFEVMSLSSLFEFSSASTTGNTSVSSIRIKTSGILDFENQPRIFLLVKVSNPRLLLSSSQSVLEINIIESNERPVITRPSGSTRLEYEIPSTGVSFDSQIGVSLSAVDQDAGDTNTWTWSHVSGPNLGRVSSAGSIVGTFNYSSTLPDSSFEFDGRLIYSYQEITVRVTDASGLFDEMAVRLYHVSSPFLNTTRPYISSMSVIAGNPVDGSGTTLLSSGISYKHEISSSGVDILEIFTTNLLHRPSLIDLKLNVSSSLTQISWITSCAWSGTVTSGVIDSIRCSTDGAWGKGYKMSLFEVNKTSGHMNQVLAGIFLGFDYASPRISEVAGIGYDLGSLEITGGALIRISGGGFGPSTAFNFILQRVVDRPILISYGDPGISQYIVPTSSGTANEISFLSVPGLGKNLQFRLEIGGQVTFGSQTESVCYIAPINIQ